jgi:hypothetical protein
MLPAPPHPCAAVQIVLCEEQEEERRRPGRAASATAGGELLPGIWVVFQISQLVLRVAGRELEEVGGRS